MAGSLNDWQLLLERKLTKELGEGDLEVTTDDLRMRWSGGLKR